MLECTWTECLSVVIHRNRLPAALCYMYLTNTTSIARGCHIKFNLADFGMSTKRTNRILCRQISSAVVHSGVLRKLNVCYSVKIHPTDQRVTYTISVMQIKKFSLKCIVRPPPSGLLPLIAIDVRSLNPLGIFPNVGSMVQDHKRSKPTTCSLRSCRITLHNSPSQLTAYSQVHNEDL